MTACALSWLVLLGAVLFVFWLYAYSHSKKAFLDTELNDILRNINSTICIEVLDIPGYGYEHTYRLRCVNLEIGTMTIVYSTAFSNCHRQIEIVEIEKPNKCSMVITREGGIVSMVKKDDQIIYNQPILSLKEKRWVDNLYRYLYENIATYKARSRFML